MEPSNASGERIRVVLEIVVSGVTGAGGGVAGGFANSAACPIIAMALMSCSMRSFVGRVGVGFRVGIGADGSECQFELPESPGRFPSACVSTSAGRKLIGLFGELYGMLEWKLGVVLISGGGGTSSSPEVVAMNHPCSSRGMWRL